MSQKLKDLKVSSVDLCPQGANPDAYIRLCKSADPPPGVTGEVPGGFHKLLTAIGKLFGKSETEIETVVKEAQLYSSVAEGVKNQRVGDEIWDYVYALQKSMESILNDPAVSDKQAMMGQSVSQFSAAVLGAIPHWAGGNTVGKVELSAEKVERLKKMRDQLDALISQPIVKITEIVSEHKNMKGETENMELNKAAMTPEELAVLAALEKKYGVLESVQATEAAAPAANTAQKAEKSTEAENTELKKALDKLNELNKRIRLGEMEKAAEKYVPLGEKPEELAKTLLAMQDVGEDTYNAFVKRLDDSLALVEKSGIFKEMGSGRNGSSGDNPLAKIESAAAELQKATPNLTHAQAFVKACETNPELAREYEQSR